MHSRVFLSRVLNLLLVSSDIDSLLCWYALIREFDGLLLDYSRQRATVETVDKLLNLAKVRVDVYWQIFIELQRISLEILVICFYMQAAQLTEKISRMFNGEHVSILSVLSRYGNSF